MTLPVAPPVLDAISSLILAVFTIALVIVTGLYYVESRKQVQEMKSVRQLEYEPRLKAGMRLTGPNSEIGFVNIGGGIAHDVHADYWIEGLEEHKREWTTQIHFPEDIYKMGIPTDDSPIGQIGLSDEIKSEIKTDADLVVEWEYKDAKNEQYKQTQRFNIVGVLEERSNSTEFYTGQERETRF